MADSFRFPKMILGLIAMVLILSFTVVGVQAIWDEYVIKNYDKHLTEQVYLEVAVNQNVNLVFYRKGCPYCEVGKKTVINVADKSSYPTFYIDVESEAGQELVKKYHIETAATLVTLRDGKSRLYQYATKNKQGKIIANEKSIKEALDGSKK